MVEWLFWCFRINLILVFAGVECRLWLFTSNSVIWGWYKTGFVYFGLLLIVWAFAIDLCALLCLLGFGLAFACCLLWFGVCFICLFCRLFECLCLICCFVVDVPCLWMGCIVYVWSIGIIVFALGCSWVSLF